MHYWEVKLDHAYKHLTQCFTKQLAILSFL